MHQENKMQEKLKQENLAYQKILVKNAQAEIEKRYKNAIKQAYLRVEEMSNSLKNQSLSHKKMQQNYTWKRWQMFVKMSSLIKSVERTKQTKIDEKMLQIATRFVREDFLILKYAKTNGVPEQLVRDQIYSDRIDSLKS